MNTLCALDYLIGTIATAYKGMVTSLVAKDFCILEEHGSLMFRGAILSLPSGRYQVCLMHGGTEIARAEIVDGSFEIAADRSVLETAKTLQLDVVQDGRHIGTFLLKRESGGPFYVSAIEISRDLRGINFKALSESVRGKEGIRAQGEAILSAVLSTKKDWNALADRINSFARDLFWHSRSAFRLWYPLLVRAARTACSQVSSDARTKCITTLLALLELPLEQEHDEPALRHFVSEWLIELGTERIDFALRFGQTLRLMRAVSGRLPSEPLAPVMTALLASLDARVRSLPLLDDRMLHVLGARLGSERLTVLHRASESSRKEVLHSLGEITAQLEHGEPPASLLDRLDTIDAALVDAEDVLLLFFRAIGDAMGDADDEDLSSLMTGVSGFLQMLPADLHSRAVTHLVRLARGLLTAGRVTPFQKMLSEIDASPAGEDLVLNREIADLVLQSGEDRLIDAYVRLLTEIPIPAPRVTGFSDETWAEITNPLHLARLSRFLQILMTGSSRLREVLVHVIASIYVSGVLIPDDQLFQRVISAYLNSGELATDPLLHHLLLKKLPVYFNEVGASGRIRDVTTELDSWGNDPVLYFLRKQVHVNASSNNVALVTHILRMWLTGDPEILKPVVPGGVVHRLDPALLAAYGAAVRSLAESLGILAGDTVPLERLAGLEESAFAHLPNAGAGRDEYGRKAFLLFRLYRDITAKYSLRAGARDDAEGGCAGLARQVAHLVRLTAAVRATEKTEARESLYFKRHIAFGIPSVIGSYHEAKFDALSELYRREETVRTLLEGINDAIAGSEGGFSPGEFPSWVGCLGDAATLFALRGLGNREVDEVLTVLRTNTLSLSQVIDLFHLWQHELTWMVETLYGTFHRPLARILRTVPRDELPEALQRLGPDAADFVDKAADVIIRDLISSIPGFEELDRILNTMVRALSRVREAGTDMVLAPVPPRQPEKSWYAVQEISPEETASLGPLLGGKAKNLSVIHHNGLPVPPGVVFPASLTESYETHTVSSGFEADLTEALRYLESRTGRRFGEGRNPLFLSVRSGSYLSMPGILSSILYVGMNEDTLGGLVAATNDPWMAWDSCRRFIEHYASVVFDLAPEVLSGIRKEVLNAAGVREITDLTASGMEELVSGYHRALAARSFRIPSDPLAQLVSSIRGVYRSWFSARARQFRRATQVSDRWGTAVLIMEMIAANARGSGASVFFTRRPFQRSGGIFGETREAATGDDLVYGTFTNRPIAQFQGDQGMSLEESDPELFSVHRDAAERIERAMGSIPQEVEAAYLLRDGRRELRILQTRRMEFQTGPARRFKEICTMESSIIGRGLGVHGGALSGIATFAPSLAALQTRKAQTRQPLILIRREPSTDDVSLMPEIQGILTAAGGATSHAAVLAQKFNLTAVVGCADLSLSDNGGDDPHAVIGDYRIREGTALSLDGSTGIVYSGTCRFTEQQPIS